MPTTAKGALDWLSEACPAVQVRFRPLPVSVRGYALRAFGQERIVLRAGRHLYPWVTIAHELGHLCTDAMLEVALLSLCDGWFERRQERAADAFAVELLVPAIELRGCEGEDIAHVAAKLRLPVGMVRLRCEQLRLDGR